MQKTLATLLVLASLCIHASANNLRETEDPVSKTALFDRVVVVGASLSAGYGLRQELNAKANFATVFSAAIRSESTQVNSHASLGFFTDPLSHGRSLLVDGLQEEPTLMVALDYLFWFGHGDSASEEARLDSLKKGLRLLESVGCPLVIGDFPDMTPALKGVNPFGVEFIRPSMLPEPATREAMNLEIHAWAKERKNVSVVPLARFMKEMLSEETVALRGNEWKGIHTDVILQEDLLHPTVTGDVDLTVLTLDTLAANHAQFCEPCVRWNAGEIHSRLLELTQEERDKNLEKARKRKERKRKREEKNKSEQLRYLTPRFFELAGTR